VFSGLLNYAKAYSVPFSAEDRPGPHEAVTRRSVEEEREGYRARGTKVAGAVTTKVFPDGNGGLAARSPGRLGNRTLKASWILAPRILAWLCASFCWAQSPANIRAPLGVYVKVDVQDAIDGYNGPAGQLHSYLQGLYASLLADPAISGLTIGAEWAKLQPSAGTSSSSFDWADLDDAFDAATAAHKPVQLIITPGTDMPTWLVNEIPSCDPLFTSGSAPANCGTVTFVGYPEVQRAGQTMFPLPWNTVYQAAWDAFLMQLNARYGSNPAFVGIAIAGPVGASDEMIFPTSANTSAAQPSGLAVDATWAALIQHSFPSNSAYQNTDQVFIDAWKQAIDAYESIFSGVTLFIGADAGDDFPNFSQTVTPHADNTLFAVDCSNSPKTEIMSCEAKTEVLSYFVTVTGLNGKGTQVGGMTASSAVTFGNIGVQGVKVLTALSPPPSPPFIGGAEFDFPVSGSSLQGEGCPDPSGNCPGLSVVEGAYNVMTVFFTGTPAAAFYGGTVGTAPIQYLEVSYLDLQYALSNACPATPSPTLGYMSLQDLYVRASRDIFAMANLVTALPASTCSKTAPPPAITLVANAEGASPTIAPNTWVEIKGSNLAQPGDTRIWQGSDFVANTMPTKLDTVSATVNGKPAFVYYISPLQVNILTPPDALSGPAQVEVTNNGVTSAAFTAPTQSLSPSFFVFNGGPYIAATHLNGSLIGPATLYPGASTPAKPGETIVLYANGFGSTNVPVQSGSVSQSGTLSPLPAVKIGGVAATVQFAGLVVPGEFQFNVTIPAALGNGDQTITATYGGVSTQSGALITLHN
jgi:uncharacterized protein (TIGR03437 family)